MKRIEQEEIIEDYSILPDHEKLGYELTIVTEITVSRGKLLEMENEIYRFPNVCCVYDVTGLTNAIIFAKFKNREDLGKFSKYPLSLSFVEGANTTSY
jgi:DNA-binding Lrp family transcriptional regulator